MVAFAINKDAIGEAFFPNEPFDVNGLSNGWRKHAARAQTETGVTFREMVQRSPLISFYDDHDQIIPGRRSPTRVFIVCRDRLAALNPEAPQIWVVAECRKAIAQRSTFSQFLDQAVPALGFSIVGALTGGAAAALLAGGVQAVDQGGNISPELLTGNALSPPVPTFARNVSTFDAFTLVHLAGGVLAALTGTGTVLFLALVAGTEVLETVLEDQGLLDAESVNNRIGDVIAAVAPFAIIRSVT